MTPAVPGSHSVEYFSIKKDPSPKRVEELGINHEQGGSQDLRQGFGGAHYEDATGRTLSPSAQEGVDFVDKGLPTSLKGPMLSKAGKAVALNDNMVRGLSESVVKDVRYNTATSQVIVDITGMPPAQQGKVVDHVMNELTSNPGELSKRIIFVE